MPKNVKDVFAKLMFSQKCSSLPKKKQKNAYFAITIIDNFANVLWYHNQVKFTNYFLTVVIVDNKKLDV
jgi:hypothetical protein